MHWYRLQKSGLKSPVLSMMPSMQGLVEDAIYVSQVKIPIFGGDAAYQWICAWLLRLPRGLINQ